MLRGGVLHQERPDFKYHLFLNDISSGSIVLSFEQIEDSELQNLDKVDIFLFFKDGINYVKTGYSIHFKYYKASGWYWLWIPLGCIFVLFLFIFGLCVIKMRKAMKKNESFREESLIPASLKTDKSTPLLNERVPDRLSPLRTNWNLN